MWFFVFYCYGDHRELPVLTHSFHTRRSSVLSRLADEVDLLLRPETLRRAETIADHLAALGAPPALTERALALFKMDGAVGLARLARKLDVSEIDVTQAFTRLGETLGKIGRAHV